MAYKLSITSECDWIHATVTGENTIENVDAYMSELFQECQRLECTKLLVEERLEGPRLGTVAVFEIASRKADEFRGFFKAIAYVDVYAEGDLMPFAETVAMNRGSRARVFATLADAEDWLRKLPDSG